MIRGFDYASYQGTIDAETASRAGYSFAIGKATEGVTYTTPLYAFNRAAVERSGMLPGSYHYASWGDPEAEADHFLATIGPLGAGHLLALDAEQDYRGDLLSWCERWLWRVKDRRGVLPLVYTNQSFAAEHNLNSLGAQGYGLWLAAWQDADPTPIGSWPFVAFWQDQTGMAIPGVRGDPTQEDLFNGPVNRLALYGAH